MGFFGGTSKRPETPEVIDSPVQEMEELPQIPELPKSTVITEGITLAGNLYGNGIVEIEGTVEGEVDVCGSVTVTATGCIRGPARADVVRIAGQVEGNVVANEHLRLEKTGVINGDVVCVSFVLEEGGRLNGRANMTGKQ